MATGKRKDKAIKRSISAPRSLWSAIEKFLDRQMPPVPLSRHMQELMAEDLRRHGMLGKEQSLAGTNGGNGR